MARATQRRCEQMEREVARARRKKASAQSGAWNRGSQAKQDTQTDSRPAEAPPPAPHQGGYMCTDAAWLVECVERLLQFDTQQLAAMSDFFHAASPGESAWHQAEGGGGRGGGKVVGPGGGGHERGESSVKGGDGGAGGEGGGGMHSTSREGWRALVRALEVDSELDSRLVPFVWPLHLSHLSRSFWCTWARAADDRSHVPATPLAREEDGDGSSAQVPLAVRMLLQVLEVYCLLSPCASTTTTTSSSSSAAARRWGGLGAGAVVLPSLLCLSEGRGQGGPWYGRVRGAGAERVDAEEEGQAGEGESSCLVQGRARVLAADGGVGSSGMAAGDGDADESGANGGAEAMEGRVEGVGGERAEGMGGVSLEERGGVRSLFWFAAGCGVPALFLERCVQIWGERERERARKSERERERVKEERRRRRH